MIDFETKTITLGYGDVAVGSCYSGVSFQNIRPPQECGKSICEEDGVEYFGEVVVLPVRSLEDCVAFRGGLDKLVESDHFTYDNWTVRFIPDSDVSVHVVREHFTSVYYHILSLCAC